MFVKWFRIFCGEWCNIKVIVVVVLLFITIVICIYFIGLLCGADIIKVLDKKQQSNENNYSAVLQLKVAQPLEAVNWSASSPSHQEADPAIAEPRLLMELLWILQSQTNLASIKP